MQQCFLCLFDCFDWHLKLSREIRRIIRPTNGLWIELLIICKLERLVCLHNFHPEELFSYVFIEIIVIFRDIEWLFFGVLKIVPSFHHSVALSYYDSRHAPHIRPDEGLKVREYCLQVAPLTLGTVNDPDRINLLSGRLVHQLWLNPWGHSTVYEACGVVEALGVENPEFSI